MRAQSVRFVGRTTHRLERVIRGDGTRRGGGGCGRRRRRRRRRRSRVCLLLLLSLKHTEAEMVDHSLRDARRSLRKEGALGVDVNRSASEPAERGGYPHVDRKLHAELRLADARRATKLGHLPNRQPAGAAEQVVERLHFAFALAFAVFQQQQTAKKTRYAPMTETRAHDREFWGT